MKKLLLIVATVSLFVACQQGQTKDPKARLEELKKQQKEISDEIKKLEAEVGKDNAGATEKPELVSVTEVTPQPFSHYIELQGEVDADANVTITPQMPGMVQRIYVAEGQSVKAGQVLAELDNDAAEKNMEAIVTQLAFATQMYDKQKALWDQKIGTEVQYLTAKNNVEALEKSLDAAREQLEMSKLISPITGVIDAVDIKTGQMASPGLNGIRVVNFSNLKVKGEVSETYSAVVHAGDKVKIFFPDHNKEIDSKITFVSRVINPESRTFTVESKLSGGTEYKPNMIAVLRIADYEKPEAIVVPVNLIQKSSDADFVYVASDQNGKKVAQRQTITVGNIYSGQAEITSGLKPGDQVITAGYQNLISGQPIQF